MCAQLWTSFELEVGVLSSFANSRVRLTILFLRYHAVQEFNKGVYDYIIATDEAGAYNEQDEDEDEDGVEEEEEECKS